MSRYTAKGTKDEQEFLLAYGKDHAVGWFMDVSIVPDYKVGDNLSVYVEKDEGWGLEQVEVLEVKTSTELVVKIQGLPDATEFTHYLEFEDLQVFSKDSMFNGLTYVEMAQVASSYGVDINHLVL